MIISNLVKRGRLPSADWYDDENRFLLNPPLATLLCQGVSRIPGRQAINRQHHLLAITTADAHNYLVLHLRSSPNSTSSTDLKLLSRIIQTIRTTHDPLPSTQPIALNNLKLSPPDNWQPLTRIANTNPLTILQPADASSQGLMRIALQTTSPQSLATQLGLEPSPDIDPAPLSRKFLQVWARNAFPEGSYEQSELTVGQHPVYRVSQSSFGSHHERWTTVLDDNTILHLEILAPSNNDILNTVHAAAAQLIERAHAQSGSDQSVSTNLRTLEQQNS